MYNCYAVLINNRQVCIVKSRTDAEQVRDMFHLKWAHLPLEYRIEGKYIPDIGF